MNRLKLTIDLLPQGAWGNNLSRTLPKKDWDVLRKACYKRAGYKCEICDYKTDDLDAHEIWNFDIENRTQTLMDIQALCSRCHGVKHYRNSTRLGHGENAKRHFLKVNNCGEWAFTAHEAQAQMLFDAQNKVLRWKIKADLDKFGGKGIELKERYIPKILSPYEGIDWDNAYQLKMACHAYESKAIPNINRYASEGYGAIIVNNSDYSKALEVDELIVASTCQLPEHFQREHALSQAIPVVMLNRENINNAGIERAVKSGAYFRTLTNSEAGESADPPRVISIDIDNYSGTITVVAEDANKIEWISDGKKIKTKYSFSSHEFKTEFNVKNQTGLYIRFKLTGEGGQTFSQPFGLVPVS